MAAGIASRTGVPQRALRVHAASRGRPDARSWSLDQVLNCIYPSHINLPYIFCSSHLVVAVPAWAPDQVQRALGAFSVRDVIPAATCTFSTWALRQLFSYGKMLHILSNKSVGTGPRRGSRGGERWGGAKSARVPPNWAGTVCNVWVRDC